MYKHQIEFAGVTAITDSWLSKPLGESYGSCSSLAQALDKIYYAEVCDGIYAITLEQTFDFNQECKKSGDESDQFKVYLTYCKDKRKVRNDEVELIEELQYIKRLLEVEQVPYAELEDEEQELASRFLHVTYDAHGKVNVEYNGKAIDKVVDTAGIFCIVSNVKKSPRELVKLYRSRNQIEDSYPLSDSLKNEDFALFSKRNKVRGAELCRMIALGYYTNLQVAINNVINQCDDKECDNKLSETAKEQYKSLKNWLLGRELRSILKWFDGIEHLDNESEYGQERLSAERISQEISYSSICCLQN